MYGGIEIKRERNIYRERREGEKGREKWKGQIDIVRKR